MEDHLAKRDEANFDGDLKLNYANDVLMLTCTESSDVTRACDSRTRFCSDHCLMQRRVF